MIKLIEGDLLQASEQYIAHQTNCVTIGPAAGLAKLLFQKYPYSDVYQNRIGDSVPGTISVHGDGVKERFVINMYAQYYPGKGNEVFLNDTRQAREKYFINSLKEISKISNIQSIAFPYQIGCGLAGGKWENYLNMLQDFADNNPNINVSLYQKL